MTERAAQAIAEFSLMLLPFLLVLMMILQIGHIVVVKIIVNHALFVSARVAAVNQNYSIIRSAAYKVIPFTDKDNIDITYTDLRNEFDLKITYNMPLIFPFASKIVKEVKRLRSYSLPVSGSYTLHKENYVN